VQVGQFNVAGDALNHRKKSPTEEMRWGSTGLQELNNNRQNNQMTVGVFKAKEFTVAKKKNFKRHLPSPISHRSLLSVAACIERRSIAVGSQLCE
jgi:hypothetical protein